MHATRTLPPSYALHARLDLSGRPAVLVGLNLVGLALLAGFGWPMVRAAYALRPDLAQAGLALDQVPGLLSALAAAVLTLFAHEGAHGLFFWVFTRQRPQFGHRGAYAFAAAPDWYLTRGQFAVVGLAPLVLITLACAGLVAWLPLTLARGALFLAIINAAGAVGDLVVVAWLLWQPRRALVNDLGDVFSIYAPVLNASS